jgi:L-seryl-tRNA(Ser) seleniumtransferase
VAIDAAPASAELLAARLRAGAPPLLARIADGRVVLNPRTLGDDDMNSAITVLRSALSPHGVLPS